VLNERIGQCADFGVKSVITFTGMAHGRSKEEGQKNCIEGLKKIVPYAEEKKVTLCLEMRNSRVNENMKGHPDYWCDHIDYALDICRAIGSERMKMLFDIYHVQIMDGDVIRRYKECAPFVGHIHTAGNPGRQELDDDQEIHYPGIMRAIAASGYTGYVGQEFIPKAADKLASLNASVKLCDVSGRRPGSSDRGHLPFPAALEELAAVAGPGGLLASVRREWDPFARAGEWLCVDFEPPGLVGGIGDPPTVG